MVLLVVMVSETVVCGGENGVGSGRDSLLSTVTVDAAAAAASRRRWLSFWSWGEADGGDKVALGVCIGGRSC